MPSKEDDLTIPLTITVPRSAFVHVAAPPATVTQHTVEQHFGIPPRMFKAMYRDGFFVAKRIGRHLFASYEDVKRAVTDGATAKARMEEATSPSPAFDVVRSEKESAKYLHSARTSKELRARKKEVQEKAWSLLRQYDETLADGSPNPDHDKVIASYAYSLVLSVVGASWPMPPYVGPKGSCMTCRRPAYATKQAWTSQGWRGAPTCESCARSRAPNERVILYPQGTILHQATGHDVPRE